MQTPAVKTLLVKNAGKEKFCTTYIMVNTPKPLPLHFTYQPSSTRRGVTEARCPPNLTTSTRGTALQKLHYFIIFKCQDLNCKFNWMVHIQLSGDHHDFQMITSPDEQSWSSRHSAHRYSALHRFLFWTTKYYTFQLSSTSPSARSQRW